MSTTFPCSTCLRPFLIVFTCEDGKDRCAACKKTFKPVPKCVRKAELRTAALERYREKREYRGGKLQHVAIRPGPNKEYQGLKKRVGL